MIGIQNFLQMLYDNWTSVLVCIGLILGIVQKTKNYLSKSEKEKIEIALSQIEETVLKMITDAEEDYEDWNKAGSIKRSQVIKEIFEKYPILSKVTNQEEIIQSIDVMIDNSLITLRKIVQNNKVKEGQDD